MTYSELIYKEKILDNIKSDSMLQHLVNDLKPLILEAMKALAWEKHKYICQELESLDSTQFPYNEEEEQRWFNDWINDEV